MTSLGRWRWLLGLCQWLSATRTTCRQWKDREDEEENERAAPCVTPVEACGRSPSSLAALDALLLPSSYSGKRDTNPIARKLPTEGWAESK